MAWGQYFNRAGKYGIPTEDICCKLVPEAFRDVHYNSFDETS